MFRPNLKLLALAGAGLATLAALPAASPAAPPPYDPYSYAFSSKDQLFLNQLNAERTRVGLTPLKHNHRLMEAARVHAENMAKLNTMSHTLEVDGLRTLDDRLRWVGYNPARMWRGENITYWTPTTAGAVANWMASPPHKAAILSTTYTDLGVGYAKSAGGKWYYCAVFGKW